MIYDPFTNLPLLYQVAPTSNEPLRVHQWPSFAEGAPSNGQQPPLNNVRSVSNTSLLPVWPICSIRYISILNKVGQFALPNPFEHPLTCNQDPIYVSEVAEKAMNPNFRNIHLESHDPQLTRLDQVRLKFWAKSDNMSNYCLLIDLDLSLRSLQFIGKTVSICSI